MIRFSAFMVSLLYCFCNNSGRGGRTKAVQASLKKITVFGLFLFFLIFQCSGQRYFPNPPKDPWRVVDGKKIYVISPGWHWFGGTVVAVHENGIMIHGWWDEMILDPAVQRDFFVENFPYPVAENDWFSLRDDLFAREAGIYRYTTVLGGSRSVHKLDYGQIFKGDPKPLPPRQLTPEEKAAAKEKEKKRLADGDAHLLKWQMDNAWTNHIAQYQLGLRYLRGDGVAKDAPKARSLLAKAAAQGNRDAAAALATLTNAPPVAASP